MLRTILPLILGLAFARTTSAQPTPCGPGALMEPLCEDACVICDINGYTGTNNNPVQGLAPQGFCTTTQHHIQWLAFIAGSTNLTLTVAVFNCQIGGGLEVGIYESLDCNNFKLVSNCNGNIRPGTTASFSNTAPLTVGQYYYFVMDGNGDDVCSYTINVTAGTTLVPPLPPAGNVTGPQNACTGQTATYSIPPVTGANFYKWTLDGQPAGNGLSVDVEWERPGVHQLCVTAFNVCDTIAPRCYTVDVATLPPTTVLQSICEGDCFEMNGQTFCSPGAYPFMPSAFGGCDSLVNLVLEVILPDTVVLVEKICTGDCFEVAGTLICPPGDYEFHLPTFSGCDSVILLSLSELPVSNSFITANICETDSILVGDTWYHPPGQYEELATSWLGCDSIIFLTLNAIVCEIDGDAQATPLVCHGDQSGKLSFSVINGTPPFAYAWEKLGGTPSGNGNLANINQQDTLNNLPPGTYLVSIFDNFGNDAVLIAIVTEPPSLSLSWSVSDFNGTNVSCHGGQDGSLEALPTGGTPGYNFTWGNGGQQPLIDGLNATAYTVTISDAAGCTLTASHTLTEPAELTVSAFFANPNCDGYHTGRVTVQTTGGGRPPYLYDLSGTGFKTETVFTSLPGGEYVLTVKDANGCTASQAGTLKVPAIPSIETGDDLTIKLGESICLPVVSNIILETAAWSPPTGLSCTDCLGPDAMPFDETTYTLEVVSADGCTATDSLTVHVLKVRDVYVPTAFSPNGDGLNDHLTIFGGKAVSQVLSFRVFSRWGELVFERFNFHPNDTASGWDGRFRGKDLPPDVFAWTAEIEFIDGVSVMVEGETMVVK